MGSVGHKILLENRPAGISSSFSLSFSLFKLAQMQH